MVDLNELAGQFANRVFPIHGVFHSVLSHQSTFFPYTAKRPVPPPASSSSCGEQALLYKMRQPMSFKRA